MRAVSLFSGAGGFELGLERAGVQTILQAEIDPWCRAVLERHWPDCERVDDVRNVDYQVAQHAVQPGRQVLQRVQPITTAQQPSPSVDLVYGGFPCQDVSVAGARAGFGGERSSLWFEFHRVLRELRPRWALIENVPGLLSSGPSPGADFGVVLRGLVDLGYGVAWRTLDARWFGVPQRRRRVFVVGCLGDAPRAATVLAVCESCGGYPPSSPEAVEGLAPTLDGGAQGTSLDLPMTIGSQVDAGNARPLVARESGYRMDFESENFVVANGLRASDGHHGYSSGRGDGTDNLMVADPISAHEGKTYTHEGKNNFRLHNVVAGVRRLTPLECERLMGWPDEHTRWTADGKEISDSHRYRLCGNGVVATVAEWLGHRLVRANGS